MFLFTLSRKHLKLDQTGVNTVGPAPAILRRAAPRSLREMIDCYECLPLVWAGSTSKMNYLNWGDAMSPVMLALVSGMAVERIPSSSYSPRVVGVGTIGHGVEGGVAHFWGTGCSNWQNPNDGEQRIPYSPPVRSEFHIHASRGPISRALLEGSWGGHGVYGDPVWLLPQFYRPAIEKTFELGVILHLSELADRAETANARAELLRYAIPDEMRGAITLINTVTEPSVRGLRNRLDEILACKRIVSTSLHGLVVAESYGIPCLYLAPHGRRNGIQFMTPDFDAGIDLRMADLYAGLGVHKLPAWVQNRRQETDWDALIKAIDRHWTPKHCDTAALLESLPVPLNPLMAPPHQTIWDHKLLNRLTLQHDVTSLRLNERERHGREFEPLPRPALRVELALAEYAETMEAVPLAWARTTEAAPHANLGDALSPVIASAISGLPIHPRQFDDGRERLVSVGTIGHAQRNGIVHFWGTGIDGSRHAEGPKAGRFAVPANTKFVPHAMRGRFSARNLRQQGVGVPDVYGDPVWFLPWLMRDRIVEPRWELGVVVHITELTAPRYDAEVQRIFRRYMIPDSLRGQVKIINTFTEPSTAALFGKVDEMRACKRIASTSFHGLVIAETFGIPCVWFGPEGRGPALANVMEESGEPLDHRVRDFYAGAAKLRLPIYRGSRKLPTQWEALIKWIDKAWSPLHYNPGAFLEAFPLRRVVDLDRPHWKLPEAFEPAIRY